MECNDEKEVKRFIAGCSNGLYERTGRGTGRLVSINFLYFDSEMKNISIYPKF
jgi:hypothetical protein